MPELSKAERLRQEANELAAKASELAAEADELLNQADELEALPRTRQFKLYTHNSKEDNWYKWTDEFGEPENDAGRTFSYCAYELEFDAEVNLDTGECWVTHLQGVELSKKVLVS